MTVSLGLIAASVAVLAENEKGRYIRFGPLSLLAALAGACTVIASFIIPAVPVLKGGMPGPFPAIIFWSGFALGAFAYIYAIYGDRDSTHSLHDKRL